MVDFHSSLSVGLDCILISRIRLQAQHLNVIRTLRQNKSFPLAMATGPQRPESIHYNFLTMRINYYCRPKNVALSWAVGVNGPGTIPPRVCTGAFASLSSSDGRHNKSLYFKVVKCVLCHPFRAQSVSPRFLRPHRRFPHNGNAFVIWKGEESICHIHNVLSFKWVRARRKRMGKHFFSRLSSFVASSSPACGCGCELSQRRTRNSFGASGRRLLNVLSCLLCLSDMVHFCLIAMAIV